MADSALVRGGRWLEAVESRPWGWGAMFLALATLLVGGMLAWWGLFGLWDTLFDPAEPLGLSMDGRSHLTGGLLLAFVVVGTLWVRRGVLRDIQVLGEMAAKSPAEIDEALRRNGSSPPLVRGVILAVSLTLGAVIIPLTSGASFHSMAGWDMHHVWGVANNTSIFFLMIDGAWLSAEGWRTIARYTRAGLTIDLLDRQRLAAIGRTGLRGAVLWLGGCIIASSLSWGMTRVAPLLVILGILLTIATASLLLPAVIARGRLREAKQAELQRVRAKIAEARDGVLEGHRGPEPAQVTLLPGLLAYESRIESVREWPYDTPTLVRFAVLAFLAVSSWLGGALVELALDTLLDR